MTLVDYAPVLGKWPPSAGISVPMIRSWLWLVDAQRFAGQWSPAESSSTMTAD
jgi:hypothetical protein